MDIKSVIDWANAVCEQALTEARGGNPSMVNRIGANSSMKLYFDNVHGLKTVPAELFPSYYSVQFKEITRLYEEYVRDEKTNAAVDRVGVLEEKLDALTALVALLLENKEEETPEPETPAKTAKKAKSAAKVEEPETEPETDEEEKDAE